MINKNRSLLFVPAKEKFLNHFKGNKADSIIFDLEDSILDNDKDRALALLTNFLITYPFTQQTYVRINKNRILQEVKELIKFPISGFMLPKMESGNIIVQNKSLFHNTSIIALVETPLGFVNIREILSPPQVIAVAFGAEDYTSSIGMENNENTIYFARSRIVMFAKAYGKYVYDTPSLNYKDKNILRKEVQSVADMGFNGKLAIHPEQIDIINEVFHHYDYESIKNILYEFDQSSDGVLMINSKIYEKPHIDHLKKIMEEMERT